MQHSVHERRPCQYQEGGVRKLPCAVSKPAYEVSNRPHCLALPRSSAAQYTSASHPKQEQRPFFLAAFCLPLGLPPARLLASSTCVEAALVGYPCTEIIAYMPK